MRRSAVDTVLVVVPARDEGRRLGRCLRALGVAADALPAAVRPVVLVVLDRCTDGSAAVVAAHPGVRALASTAGSAGGARRTGAAAGLQALGGGGAAGRTWLASTDADSVVPAHWLTTQVAAAAAGADLVLGTVRPDASEAPDGVVDAWRRGYAEVEGHPHVHAANLGVRASAYLAAGGFPAVAAHEDVLLVDALVRRGAAVVRTAAAPVLTSARLRGRAPHGFAAHLRAVADGAGPAA